MLRNATSHLVSFPYYINPLIITLKENAGIFCKVCHEPGATRRELVAEEWSLSLFLKSDLKNYTFQSHYILDISAVKEKGDDFISLIYVMILISYLLIDKVYRLN